MKYFKTLIMRFLKLFNKTYFDVANLFENVIYSHERNVIVRNTHTNIVVHLLEQVLLKSLKCQLVDVHKTVRLVKSQVLQKDLILKGYMFEKIQ